jgi:hypothetical protein
MIGPAGWAAQVWPTRTHPIRPPHPPQGRSAGTDSGHTPNRVPQDPQSLSAANSLHTEGNRR